MKFGGTQTSSHALLQHSDPNAQVVPFKPHPAHCVSLHAAHVEVQVPVEKGVVSAASSDASVAPSDDAPSDDAVESRLEPESTCRASPASDSSMASFVGKRTSQPMIKSNAATAKLEATKCARIVALTIP
jgi:hypothetical protein